MGRGHETILQEVKGQGHMRLKLDLETWWRYHSRPLRPTSTLLRWWTVVDSSLFGFSFRWDRR